MGAAGGAARADGFVTPQPVLKKTTCTVVTQQATRGGLGVAGGEWRQHARGGARRKEGVDTASEMGATLS